MSFDHQILQAPNKFGQYRSHKISDILFCLLLFLIFVGAMHAATRLSTKQ